MYAISGLVSLGYQVVWFRLFVDRFGSTNLTFLLVLGAFIGGLGLGSAASRRLVTRLSTDLGITDELRIYGVIELLIAVLALLAVATGWVPADTWGTFPYHQSGILHVHHPLYQLSKAGIIVLCVLLPCTLMGATFPLICAAFPGDRRLPARLYAWNTLGACAGVLVLHFLLLPGVGHIFAYLLLVGLNVALGVYFLVAGGGPGLGRLPAPPAPASEEPRPASEAPGISSLLACAALTGFVSGALEGDMFRRVTFVGGNSSAGMAFVSFWAILAIFLASTLVERWRTVRWSHLRIGFALAVVTYGLTWRYIYAVRSWFSDRDLAIAVSRLPAGFSGEVNVTFPTSLGQILFIVGVVVFPTCFLVSTLFPYVCNRLHARGGHLGAACGINTLAFCTGLLCFSWLAPSVNVFYSMRLMPVCLALCAAAILTLSEHAPMRRGLPVILLTAMSAAACLVPQDLDVTALAPDHEARRYPVHSMKSNGADTTYVVADPSGPVLYFNEHPMSGANYASIRYMRLMAHFPLLTHPSPRDALLIGFGCGNTCSAIASHPTIERIDVVDLNRRVIETAPQFGAWNKQVHRDPRIRFVIDDGRNYLAITDRRYDLITSEPPPPMMPGIYRLYSEEYYRAVLSRLTPRGLMTQWLPLNEMPVRAAAAAVQSFVTVFPHTLSFAGFGDQVILVGSAAPIDLHAIEERFFQSLPVTRDLAELRVRVPLDLLARILANGAQLRAESGSGPGLSDRRNDLEYIFTEPWNPSVASYRPAGWVNDPRLDGLTSIRELRSIVSHPGRLLYRIRDFPGPSLARSPLATAPGGKRVDWVQVQRLMFRFDQDLAGHRLDAAVDLLQKQLALSAELPASLLDLATVRNLQGRHAEALPLLDAFDRLEPGEARGPLERAASLLALGRRDEATASLRHAAALAPKDLESRDRLELLQRQAPGTPGR